MGAHGPATRSLDAARDGVLLAAAFAHYGVALGDDRWGEQQVLCPVHGESRPSLRVNTERGVAYCHSCEFKGNALHLIMAMEGVSYDDARERADVILRDAGIEIKRPAGRSRYQRPGLAGPSVSGGKKYVPPGRRSA